MHADRAVDLALPAEQAAQREVQVDRLRIDLDDLDERLDRLVGLLVQQEIEPAEIRQRQRPRFAQQVLDVDARGEPAQREEQRRDRQQPPELEIHRARMRARAGRRCDRAVIDRRRRREARRPGADRAGIGASSAAALLAAQPAELALQPRRAQRAGEQPRGDADRERDEHDEDQRRLPAPPVVELERHQLGILQREEQQRHEQRGSPTTQRTTCIAASAKETGSAAASEACRPRRRRCRASITATS